MECFSSLIKYILISLNLIFVVCGAVLIAIGAVLLVQEGKGLGSFTEFSVSWFAIAVGVIIFTIAAFGFFGALKEHSCLLTTYAAILIVLFILQVALGALALVAVRNDDGALTDKIADTVRTTFTEESQGLIDDIQQWFECCGVDGSRYWTEELDVAVPGSCCDDNDCVNNQPYSRGCATAFKDNVSYYITVVGIVGIAFAAIELLGAIFAFVVRKRVSSLY